MDLYWCCYRDVIACSCLVITANAGDRKSHIHHAALDRLISQKALQRHMLIQQRGGMELSYPVMTSWWRHEPQSWFHQTGQKQVRSPQAFVIAWDPAPKEKGGKKKEKVFKLKGVMCFRHLVVLNSSRIGVIPTCE